MYCGVPVHLGKNGVEKIVELDLSAAELEALQTSAKAVASGIADVQAPTAGA
jgi:malate dehydrogenase